MTDHLLQKITIGWAGLLIALIAMLGLASTALAVQTSQYDPFSRCPTAAPALNEPASEVAICAAGVAQKGALKIGALTIPLSRFDVQFGTTGLGVEEPDCPEPGLCFGRAPGTTTIASAPSVLRVNPSGREHEKGDGKGVSMKVTIESAGDIRALSPGFIFGLPVPVYELPIKLHIEAPWVGKNCYVGSDDKPILLTPFAVGEPTSIDIIGDPNGFNTEVLTLTGIPLADEAIALPAAKRCGHGLYKEQQSQKQADILVNDLLGLPSPSGANEVVLQNTDLALAAAGFDGTPPEGGAELQAAFNAAK